MNGINALDAAVCFLLFYGESARTVGKGFPE